MTDHSVTSHPPDICLLLRAHGEQRWLISKLVPLLRQLEQPGSIPEEQLGAALAYLEVLWLDACLHAAETDAAFAKLDPARTGRDRDGDRDRDGALYEKARRYHAAVRRLRNALARRVARLTRLPDEVVRHEHTSS